ncbi:multidrug MFS transporter [Ureibacillus massiliensis 4400831 = CIP 108448 = CCUG 49529]|uniref:Multidrug MFS transporter n=1 Tax=Ureibacillus massiliensis 4400831 = CIP 108448 = CCUG 49529 TaxID=1211035 RepID=A0A0A3IZP8_9BACL|nr:MFS transporter [Ureibacillus massiliensis]KGR90244.1 multidrug MFS transporter [Ureibacillus massiliensis 4400831 = CIP 108448 = CCUG 49529]RKJ57369.1 MFS transporter [Butyricicoccus sp. 1XD8-22]
MSSKVSKVTIIILLSNIFVSFVGIGLVIPVLPTIMDELDLNGSYVGYMVAAFSIAQFIVSPFAGKWADIVGRKRMIILGLIIFSFSEFLFGIGQSIEVLFLSRILGGVSSAFIMPSVTAFIADITTVQDRAKILGYMSAAINTGFIIGPGIGGFLAGLGSRAPFFAAAILAGLAAILSFIYLKEPDRVQNESNIPTEKFGMKRIFSGLYLIPFLLLFTSTFGLASFESLFSLFVDHKFQFTPFDIAIIVTGGGLVGAIVQVLFFDPLTKKLGEIVLVRYCFIFSALLVWIMTVVETYLAVMITSCIIFVGFDLIRPAITSFLTKVARNEQGFVGGMNSMFTSLGNIFGPIAGGLLFDENIHYPYYFATIILILSIFLSAFWVNTKENSIK